MKWLQSSTEVHLLCHGLILPASTNVMVKRFFYDRSFHFSANVCLIYRCLLFATTSTARILINAHVKRCKTLLQQLLWNEFYLGAFEPQWLTRSLATRPQFSRNLD
ncbi:unnamed protein product [Cylicostephanus goldi]|uniref:Uncharacterized protein n=1 Tax=Cylicostephanus goldi TaxID=71465 RepID=A0A3P6SC69_CYLGO|nr:unnamed protein product [Cylicostephanus goldi]